MTRGIALPSRDQATPGTDTPRCPATSTEGARCIHDEGHDNDHFAKDSFSYYSWPVSGTPTNPEATERLAEIRAEVATWEPHWIEGSDGMVRELLATVDSLLTERDALQKALTDLGDYDDLRVMRADLAEARERLADTLAYNTRLIRDLRQRTDKCFELKDRAEAAEATLTRYRNALEQIATNRKTAMAHEATACAALDGPKEEET